jgi:hypothetical protein
MTRKTKTASEISRVIREQLFKVCAVMLALALLIGWVHEFVLTGLRSNLYLNGAIVGLFLFGVAMVLRGLLALRNEDVAFAALEEAFEDNRRAAVENARDPFWRHQRALQPGQVFAKPKALGHIFELTYDELQRSQDLRISASTLQAIVDGVDARLAEQRSLGVYITGLLVFLGLIGTFVGLMEMVGSVGGIIGSLQSLQGNNSNAIQLLLRNLEEPLRGMATGFSSSLFGLFGSLVLGVISRMGATASGAMKQAFEARLAAVAQMDTARGGDVGELARMISDNLIGAPTGRSAGGAAAGAQAAQNGQPQGAAGYGGFAPLSDVGMVATLSQGFGRSQESLNQLNLNLTRLVETQETTAETIRQLAVSMERMAADAHETREQLSLMNSQQLINGEFLQEIVALNRTVESRLTAGFNGMAHVMEVTGQAYLDGLRRLTAENYETNARLAKLLDVKAASDRITEIATGIESKVKGSFATMGASMERTANVLELNLERLLESQREMREALKGGVGGTVGMSAEFETKLSNSFSEMSRSFETVFAAYSTIVSRALATQAIDGQGAAAAVPVTASGLRETARERALEAAWTPKAPVDAAQAAADEDERLRRFYETAQQQLRQAGQAG